MFSAFPEAGIAGAWGEFKSVQLNPDTALDGKTKELMGLAVASQIPCSYCIYFHTAAAKANGASEEEIKRGGRDGGDRAALEHGAERDAGRSRDLPRRGRRADGGAAPKRRRRTRRRRTDRPRRTMLTTSR